MSSPDDDASDTRARARVGTTEQRKGAFVRSFVRSFDSIRFDSIVMPGAKDDAVRVEALTYAYPGHEPVVRDWSLNLPPGSRCLLSGANGAGKTTLLHVMAGKTMVGEDAVRVLGRPPFHDIALTCDGDLSHLGAQWRRHIGFGSGRCRFRETFRRDR